jgi:nucleoside recognition membrane protein YjiH
LSETRNEYEATQAAAPAPLLRFLLPSLIGAVIFLLPVQIDGVWTILLGVISDGVKAWIGDAMGGLLLLVLTVSSLVSVSARLYPPLALAIDRHPLLKVFEVPPLWIALRAAGTIIAWMIVFTLGPEFIWSDLTGGVALLSLAATIITIFLCASFLLPMLTDYGLMEFVGTLLQRVFRRLFTLPGRAAVDALASWLSSAPVGVLITISQYEQGNYSRREAVVIATNFSVTSLPFCLFVITFIGLEHLFFPVYGTVVAIGVTCAIVLPRIPPLRGLPELRDATAETGAADQAVSDRSLLGAAVHAARVRAATGPGPRGYMLAALRNVLDTWMGLLPLVVLIGTLGLAIAEFTTIIQTIATPLAPVLAWFGIPEAQAAAPTFIVGFLDMFLPAALGQSIEAEFTRYVIAAVSLTQLIYLSEVGTLLLRSALRVSLGTLLAVFTLRTLIGFPIALLSARLVLGTP